MPDPDLTLIREFKRRAEETLPGRIGRVMLYSSRARGDARDDSDWDVAVFLKGKPTTADRHALSDIGFDLMMESGQCFQTIAIDAPAGVIHLAYYAMLHAASAVLLDRFGEAPKTRAGVIGRFSQVVMATDEGRRFGRALSKTEQFRTVSDYDDGAVPTAAEAEGTRTTAIEFVAYCRSPL